MKKVFKKATATVTAAAGKPDRLWRRRSIQRNHSSSGS